jgi:hypothetical protein
MGLFQGLLCLIWDLNLGNPGLDSRVLPGVLN